MARRRMKSLMLEKESNQSDVWYYFYAPYA